jgi:uncharacterized protein (DUF3084 family)
MKNLYFIAFFSFVLMGCNMGPNKEARIQALELETAHNKDQIDKMEIRLQAIEDENKYLKAKVREMELELQLLEP